MAVSRLSSLYLLPVTRLSAPAIFLSLVMASCCLFWTTTLTPTWLFGEHLRHKTLPQAEAITEQLHVLTAAWHREEDTFDTFRLEGFDLCETCFTTLYGISSSTWHNRKGQVRAGQRQFEHGSSGHGGRVTENGYNCRLWMADYFYTLGDHQPDTGQIHIPPGDKKDIFIEMQAELGQECISEPHFYKVWTEEFAEVRIPAQQRLGKCKTCDEFHKEIVATRDPARRAQVKSDRKEHMTLVKKDRMVYHSWRKKARDEPEKYMVIITDGMDQSKTDIPNHNTSESVGSLPVRVIGAIVHGARKLAYAYLVTDFTKETNTSIEVLRRTIDAQEKLPPTLIVQLDNTSQENKNSHLFAFLAELTEARVFECIIVNFLPVGHTHVRSPNVWVCSRSYIYVATV